MDKDDKTNKTTQTEASFKGKVAAVGIKFVGNLSFKNVQRLGRILGHLMYRLNVREVQIARRNIELCFPELSASETESFLKESFLHSGMLACEIAHLWCADAGTGLSLVNKIQGEEILENAIESRRGVLIILPHLGNWEMVNAYLMSRMQLCAMYSPAQLKEVDEIMYAGRVKTGMKVAQANKSGVLKLIECLKNGENIIILPDQEPPKRSGVFAPFFNTEALTMTLISNMLMKSGAVPVIAYVERLGLGEGFNLIFDEPADEIHNQEMRESLTELNASVERCIKKMPEQYMWGYKRFRVRPEGEAPLYKNLR